MNTLRLIKSNPKIDGNNFVEWARSFHDFIQISWRFLRKGSVWTKKTEPTLKSGSKEMDDPIEGSDYDTGNINELESSNVDDMKALDSTNDQLFSVVRLTT